VRRALVIPKTRRATKPTRASKEKRLDEKRRNSSKSATAVRDEIGRSASSAIGHGSRGFQRMKTDNALATKLLYVAD
jgi:hypothetical protein